MRRGVPEIERGLKREGLLVVEYGVFATLSAAPDHTLRLGDLADHADPSQSRLTHRLRDLVQRGDIRITPDPDDLRARNATLTAQGLRRLERLAPVHVESVRRITFDPLDAPHSAVLADSLSAIAATLCDHEPFRPAPSD